jgi:hypothetical protein
MLFLRLRALLSPEKWRSNSIILLGIPNRFLRGSRASGNCIPFFLKGELIMDLEGVFCSKTRMRILKLLFQFRQLNTSCIAQRLGTNYTTTIRSIMLLQKVLQPQIKIVRKKLFFKSGYLIQNLRMLCLPALAMLMMTKSAIKININSSLLIIPKNGTAHSSGGG